jgi:hypothetical protein
MGHEFVEFSDRMVGDSVKHVAEPSEWVDFHQFTRRDEAA